MQLLMVLIASLDGNFFFFFFYYPLPMGARSPAVAGMPAN